MSSDITITGGTTSISTTDQLATADELLGRVRDRIVGNAGTGRIVESLFLKAAIDVASNLPEDGTIVSDAAIERAIRALEKKVMDKIATAVATETASRDAAIEAAMIADTGIIKSGARILFQQSNAPTGWTKDTAHNDKALRVVSGSAGGGGNAGFLNAFANKQVQGSISNYISGSIAGHTLTSGQIPKHDHGLLVAGDNEDYGGPKDKLASLTRHYRWTTKHRTDMAGDNEPHSHGLGTLGVISTFRGSSIDMRVSYVDVIIATKD